MYSESKAVEACERFMASGGGKNWERVTRNTALYPHANQGMMDGIMYLGLGLGSEAGEVAGLLKKAYRAGEGGRRGTEHMELRERLREEIGDCFWYLTQLCQEVDVTEESCRKATAAKLRERAVGGAIANHT